MSFRVSLAVVACKFTRGVLRIMGKGGTALPGKVALKICPDILRHLAGDVEVLLVTGTNGKTTTSRMLEQVFIDENLSYFANRSGANLLSGITAEFAMNADNKGRPKKDYAVIECDEAASKAVLEYVKPKVILVTNIFRDQLDRFGEVTHTLDSIKIGVSKTPDSILCLNADCSLTASIAGGPHNSRMFFGVDLPIYSEQIVEVSDAPHCIRCKAEYEYDYITYGHLGGFRCTQCDYARVHPEVAVTNVLEHGLDSTTVEFTIAGIYTGDDVEREDTIEDAVINLPGGYNIYNAAGAVAATLAMGFPYETAFKALASFQCGFGRMEKFMLSGVSVRMILVKNPAGCNQVLNFLSELDTPTRFVVCLNDRTADGTDISWIWDVNFEKLVAMDELLTGVMVCGVRRDDMAVRLKYAGLPEEKIEIYDSYDELLKDIQLQEDPVVIMPTYTAMLDIREKISAKFGYKDFWE